MAKCLMKITLLLSVLVTTAATTTNVTDAPSGCGDCPVDKNDAQSVKEACRIGKDGIDCLKRIGSCGDHIKNVSGWYDDTFECENPKCDHEKLGNCYGLFNTYGAAQKTNNMEKVCKAGHDYIDCAIQLECKSIKEMALSMELELLSFSCDANWQEDKDLPSGCDKIQLRHCKRDLTMPKTNGTLEERCGATKELVDCLTPLDCGDKYKEDAAGMREKMGKMGCSASGTTPKQASLVIVLWSVVITWLAF